MEQSARSEKVYNAFSVAISCILMSVISSSRVIFTETLQSGSPSAWIWPFFLGVLLGFAGIYGYVIAPLATKKRIGFYLLGAICYLTTTVYVGIWLSLLKFLPFFPDPSILATMLALLIDQVNLLPY